MTHGVIKIIGRNGEVFWLHTTHTGQNVRHVIERTFDVLIEGKPYLIRPSQAKNIAEGIKDAFVWDGSLLDWLFVPECVAALIVTAAPLMYTIVGMEAEPPKQLFECNWTGVDKPTILEITDEGWQVRYSERFSDDGEASIAPVVNYDLRKMLIKAASKVDWGQHWASVSRKNLSEDCE